MARMDGPGGYGHLEHLIARHGWAVQAVMADGESPPYAYTVGLERRGLPEVIVFGIPYPDSLGILNKLAERATNGEVELVAGAVVDGLNDIGVRMALVDVDDSGGHLLAANTHAKHGVRPVCAVQLVFPSPDLWGPWPWEQQDTALPLLGPVPAALS